MKGIYQYIIVASLAMLAVGCQSEPVDVLQAEPDYATVELSSTSIAIAKDGGVRTLFVGTNRQEMDVKYACDWVDVSIEQNALTLYIDENEALESRMAIVDVVVGTEPDVAKARLKIYQAGDSTENLSANGTANCYIAQTGRSYFFDASIKGNGSNNDGNSYYIHNMGLELTDGTYATLAWEATYDGDKTRSTKIINEEPIYSPDEKVIYFSTGEREGNALLCLHNAEGDILWSWHIWVCNDTIGTSQANDYIWQDRNLGALCNEIGDVTNRGMLYQWGRKEPFLPSSKEYITVPTHSFDEEGNLLETDEEYEAIQAEIVAAREKVNINNPQTGDGLLSWHYVGEVPPVALEAPGNIDYAIQHPTTILGCRVDIPVGEYVFDWYLQQDLIGADGTLQQSNSQLWGDGEKTIFDPCPVGYMVPPADAFDTIPLDYACINITDDWSKSDYGWTWTGGNGDYFPSAGNFDVSGLIGETSEKILYWTSETFGSNSQGFGKAASLFEVYGNIYYGIYPLLDPDEMASWYSYGARCISASVRCVKEQK